MEIVFHRGTSPWQKAKVSVIRRIDGRGGKIYVPRAMYSLRMSFWIVPPTFDRSAPCFFATATYSASRIDAVALIVIEVVIVSSGMSRNRISMSASEQIDT